MVHFNRVACLLALLANVQANPVVNNVRDDKGQARKLPQLWPAPQQITATGCGISLKGAVTIVTGNATDAATIDTIKAVVKAAGGKPTVSAHTTNHGTQILVGTETDNDVAAAAAKSLTGDSAKGLAADGYVLATGKYEHQPTVVLNGVDTRGTFYASQTLRQLAEGRHGVPGVKVRDWPLMAIRGSIEGFYGVPWSHQARLDQYVFYGKHKMNTYIYTPKSDSFLRDDWRKPYGSDDLTQLKELITTAEANHVDFTFALSPGLDLCYSSDDDFNTTVTKFNQVRDLGVNSFYIALDDIPLEFHCDSDKKKWPDNGDWHWIADAQAYYLNRIQTEYLEANGLLNLQTVPTNYAGSQPDPYKEEFGTQLNKNISIQWTGEGVFSPNVTVESVVRADSTYVTDKLYFWDNFPVNDGKTNRLFLNPLTGRDADLYKHLLGFTSNPMVQAYASMIALANYGDYTWNGPAYDADKSMAAALLELAGGEGKVHDALVAFVDLNQNWPYRTPTVNAPQLNKDISAFWAARKGSSSDKKDGTKALRNRLQFITILPDVLPRLAMKGFATDSAPWATVAMQWATACQHLVAMLDAIDAGDKAKATKEFNSAQDWVTKTKAKTVSGLNDKGEVSPNMITPVTGDGAFDTFLANATTIYEKQ
ncbi:hypothetical protein PLICBS_000147 [Purpureocillium lilacinum]|uniref:uncharacterized protein n=1 Tax=Purpureocillium lilacinum TaxID=33203 RepID=UPI002083E7E5|nr:hypothetical protein PLICBS_000147 [Purpureocillium lilacinum]